jgi:hypothetical protein
MCKYIWPLLQPQTEAPRPPAIRTSSSVVAAVIAYGDLVARGRHS